MPSYAQSYEPRVRVEVYFPVNDEPIYHHYLDWLIEELTRLHGGCTVQDDLSGYYLSRNRNLIEDRIKVIYSDFQIDWSQPAEREQVLSYCLTVRQVLLENLWEEEILVSAYPVSHVRP